MKDRSPSFRSTWMCYARRQRSSWARIKLSVKIVYLSTFVPKHLFQSYFVLASKFYFVWVFKVCLTRFLFAHLVLVQKFHCCSIFNDQMPLWGRPQVDSLPIIHQLPLFVKHFFKSFFVFLLFSFLFTFDDYYCSFLCILTTENTAFKV